MLAGTFRLRHNLSVSVVHDSLTFDHVVAVCDIGYQFNKNILLCGKSRHLVVTQRGQRSTLCGRRDKRLL